MMMFLAIALGGAAGAVSRYALSLLITGLYGTGFQPVATLMVNTLGSGAMGICYGLLGLGIGMVDPMRGLVMIGFLGALTTFSSFALDAAVLFDKGQTGLAAGYVMVSVVASLASFALMVMVARTFAGGQ